MKHVLPRGIAASCLLVVLMVAGCRDAAVIAPERGPAPQALVVSSAMKVSQLSAGEQHRCAIKADGTVVCWGSIVVPGGTSLPAARAVSGGSGFSCAIDMADQVVCWGANTKGQTAVPAGLTAKQVAAGGEHVCAIKLSDEVLCWGSNANGESTVPAALGPVRGIASGTRNTCVIKVAGPVVCWGYEGWTVPKPPSSSAGALAIAVGGNHACAIKPDRTVVCWGLYAFGLTVIPSDVGTVKRIATGNQHTCVIRDDDTVKCWGDNDYGQLNVPTQAATAKQVVAGNFSSCAVTMVDEVLCWGLVYGTIPTESSAYAPSATFIAPASVTANTSFTLALNDAKVTTPAGDVAAAAAGIEYAFDCGAGYGALGSANSAVCAAPAGGSIPVKGKVRDKDGGTQEYTATVAVAAPTLEYDTTRGFWDSAADFAETSNPNGPWQSGWTASLGSEFTSFSANGLYAGRLRVWGDPAFDGGITNGSLNSFLLFGKNVSTTQHPGVAPGQVFLHPGCGANPNAVLRWTAPQRGLYSIRAQFFEGAAGNTSAHILRNGNAAGPLYATQSTTTNPAYNSPYMLLNAGEWFDFVVGAAGSCDSDATPLSVQITRRWDLKTDFVTSSNPEGAWSTGWSSSLLGARRLHTANEFFEGLRVWFDPALEVNFYRDHALTQWAISGRNVSGQVMHQVLPGDQMLHPGCSGQYTFVRWTAPVAGRYRITWWIGEGEAGRISATMLLGSATVHAVAATHAAVDVQRTIDVAAGGSLVLLLGRADDTCNSDSSPIRMTAERIPNRPPVAVVTQTSYAAETNQALQFSAAPSFDADGDALGYSWNFGDGATASGMTASHAYTAPGNYTAVVTVTDAANASATASAAVVITVPPAASGPVALWKAEQNFADAIGGNHATAAAGATVGFAAGKAGDAFVFNGTGGLRVANAAALESPTLTVSAWAKRSGSPGSYRYLVGKGFNACVNASWGLYTGSGGGLQFYIAPNASSALPSPAALAASVWDGNWHHVIGTFDGSAVRLYVDGVQVGSGTPVQAAIQYAMPNRELDIGYSPTCTDGSPPFTGMLDEVMVRNGALTEAEIAAGHGLVTASIATWKGEGAFDDEYDLNDAVVASGAAVTFAAGRAGQALVFNGSGGLRVPTAVSLESPTISVSVWAKRTASPGAYRNLVAKGLNFCANGSWGLYTGSGGGAQFYIGHTSSGFMLSPAAPAATVWDGNWHHIAGTFDGSTIRLYVDGVEVGSGTAAPVAIQYAMQTRDINIGYSSTCGDGSPPFTGMLDEITVTTSAFTPARIAELNSVAGDLDDARIVWDASADFTDTANPNDAWMAGYTSSLGGAFNRMGTISTYADRLRTWGAANQAFLMFGKNVTAEAHPGVAPGELFMHPSCNGASAVLRWIAPYSASFDVHAQFLSGAPGNTSAHVLRNGALGSLLYSAPSTSSDPVYDARLDLAAGEALDFVVGSDGGCDSDATPIDIRIAKVLPNDPPVARIAQQQLAALVGQPVAFDGSASTDPNGDALQYEWAFGNGQTASGVHATTAYDAAGLFDVSLTVRDPAGERASTSARAVISDGLAALPSVCDDRITGVATDGGDYFVGAGDCIARFSSSGVFRDARTLSVALTGLNWVSATGKLVGRAVDGGLYEFDYTAGTGRFITGTVNADPQRNAVADPDGQSYWIYDVVLQQRRVADGSLITSFAVGGQDAFAVSDEYVYVLNGNVTAYTRDGAIVGTVDLPSAYGCATVTDGAAFGAAAGQQRLLYASDCRMARADFANFAFAIPATPKGEAVKVAPMDEATGETAPIVMEFASIELEGKTKATTKTLDDADAPAPPSNYRVSDDATYYDIETTAVFEGEVEVCIDYSASSLTEPGTLRLLHYDSSAGGWVDITTSIDPQTNTICGATTSLSPFMIAQSNHAPTVGLVSLAQAPVAVGQTVTVSAQLFDADQADVHTATVTWSDGVTTPAAVSESGGIGSVLATRTFTQAGVYTVVVAVNDGVSSASATSADEPIAYAVVYDPGAGFVTGGGWIESPAGAYPRDPSLAGKATFGFVSRYQKGTQVPAGNTEFEFRAGGLRFRSTSYEWLVVAGARAQFKGTGTIAGMSGSFTFLLSAIDGDLLAGQPDRFRIKLIAADGTVIYDNQAGAAETDAPAGTGTLLQGGSVVIHR